MEPDLKSSLIKAYSRLLRPLVQILLRTGVTYPEFADLAKRVFVEAATREIRRQGDDDSATRISLVTGMSQRETVEVLEQRNAGGSSATSLEDIEAILSGWHTDPRFVGPYGLPLELSLHERNRPDFATLTAIFSPRRKAQDLVRELVRVGVVLETSYGMYRVLTRTYMPAVTDPESLDRLGRAVQFFVETIEFNRRQVAPDDRRFERTVTSDFGIRPEDLGRLQSLIRTRGQALLEEIDTWLSMREKPDSDLPPLGVKAGLGIFHYVEEQDEDIT